MSHLACLLQKCASKPSPWLVFGGLVMYYPLYFDDCVYTKVGKIHSGDSEPISYTSSHLKGILLY